MRPEHFQNFKVVSYLTAFDLAGKTNEDIRKNIEEFQEYAPLDKLYIENHRGAVDIPVSRLKEVQAMCQEAGIQTSGGIVATALIHGERKPSIFDTLCYTEEAHREKMMQIVEDLAGVFDEIILDDYYFTACRCRKCIAAKGNLSWGAYRRKIMDEFAEQMVKRAHEINPRMNFIIKYPNWYKSYQELGYDPEHQRNIFDHVYAGAETREAVHSQQHLQRYHSYSVLRWFENVAPGRNQGGWIDVSGSSDKINRFLEQGDAVIFAGAREMMLWNLGRLVRPEEYVLPAFGKDMKRLDHIRDLTGRPVGVPVYEPFNSEGEDFIYNYLGMRGIPFEPVPDFPAKAPSVFLTQSSAGDPEILEKLKKYLIAGGNAVITTGFLRAELEDGIRDLTCVEPTGRFLQAREYMLIDRNHVKSASMAEAWDSAQFEILSYRENAAWPDVVAGAGEFNTPLLTEEDYGDGRLFVLNLPSNYADIYRIPQNVWDILGGHMTAGLRVFASAKGQFSLFEYENGVYGIQNYDTFGSSIRINVRGQSGGIRDVETGETFTEMTPQPLPCPAWDGVSTVPEEPFFSVELPVDVGRYRFFELI